MVSNSDPFPKMIRKKDRHCERFQKSKLHKSIEKTLHHAGKDTLLAHKITQEVCRELSRKGDEVDVADVRTAVKRVLRKERMKEVVEHYDLVFFHVKKLKVKEVIKRDGRKVAFEPYKIFKAIRKAFDQAGIKDGKTCEKLTREVLVLLEKKFSGAPVPVETVKEDIEYVIVKNKFPQAAKAYLLYRYL